ncbi:MAG: NRDE family protein [Ignavibacteriaceae bacterium]
MCVLLLAKNVHPEYKLIIAANRDEFYNRPAEPARLREPDLFAGKDLKEGGTWLGITMQGKFAAITNYRDLRKINHAAPSRGHITSDYLTGDFSPVEYYHHLKPKAHLYNGFNLVWGAIDELYYYSNVNDNLVKIDDGIHVVSNAFLNTPWHKVKIIRERMQQILNAGEIDKLKLLDLLRDRTPAPDEDLPDTGVGTELERKLSPVFVHMDEYGTRCSTIIMTDKKLKTEFLESVYDSEGNQTAIQSTDFQLSRNV